MEIELIEPSTETSTELTVQARAYIALKSTKTEQDLLELVKKSAVITEIKNTEGRDECHGVLMTLVNRRVTITKSSKDARDDATKFSKACIAEESRLIDITQPEETRLRELRDGWDAKIEAEKEAKKAAERARIMAINQKIADMRGFVSLALECRTAARIDELLGKLAQTDLTGFEEFESEAKMVHAEAMKRVEAILANKHQEEQERERIKAEQQAEAARLATERAALDAERIAIANAQTVANARIAEEKRQLEEQRAALDLASKQATAPVLQACAATEKIAEPAPVDDFETQVQAFAAAVVPAKTDPAFVAIHNPAQHPLEPTDAELIGEIRAHLFLVYGWTDKDSADRLAAITNWTI